jgi:CRP/FNR family transcriptional regulator
LAAGQALFCEGDTAGDVFGITQGSVSLSKTLGDGRRQIIGFLRDGDFIGFAQSATWACTAEALTPVEVCRFPAEPFGRFSAAHPALERRLLGIATSELAAAQDQMLLLGRKTSIERLASFLVRLAGRAVAHAQSGDSVSLPMTRGDIADHLGLTVETVSRSFTMLRKSGVIELADTNRVRILSAARLRALAGKE